MPIGDKSDFVIYQVEMQSGTTETLEQNAAEIESGANSTIRIISLNQKGEFEKNAFFKNVTDLVSRRDPTDTTAATSKKLEQSETAAVKVNGTIGPVDNTLDSFKKIGEDPAVMSFVLGQQFGVGIALDYVNTGILAAATAMRTEASMVHSDLTTTLNAEVLNDGLRKMGDRASRVRALVMHSTGFRNLIGNQILEKVTGISDVVIYGGSPGSLGRPVYVTDSEALIITDGVSAGVDSYITLGLTEDAIVMNQSEEQTVVTDLVTGLNNLVLRLQGEYAFTVAVKGFAYTGAAAPDDSVLGNGANWTYTYADNKAGPGVAIITA